MRKKTFLSLMYDRRGQQVMEYFLVLAGIAAAIFAGVYIVNSRKGLETYRDKIAGWIAVSKPDAPSTPVPKGGGE